MQQPSKNNIAYKAVSGEHAAHNLKLVLVAGIKTRKFESLNFVLQENSDLLSQNTLQNLLSQITLERGYWGFLLLLLKQGFPFPEGLNINLIPRQERELLKFIAMCQRCTGLISNNSLEKIKKAVDAQKIPKTFRSLDNQSALTIAFGAQCYESYVFLKVKGFSQFVDEAPLEINKLSMDAQLRVKRAMISYINERK